MTDIERRVIDILVKHGVTTNREDPFRDVERALEKPTLETRRFVQRLIDDGFVHWEPIVANGPAYDAKYRWVEGKSDAVKNRPLGSKD